MAGCGTGSETLPMPDASVDGSATCASDLDCPGAACVGGACVARQCTQSSDCPVGRCIQNHCTTVGCALDTDCFAGRCVGGMCIADECTQHDDCSLTGRCENGMCLEPDCTIDSQCETGVCVSGTCRAACNTGAECSSGVCANGRCALADCSDGVRNGDETDIDCGGSLCALCAANQMCSSPSDCATRSCTNGVCGSSSCTDRVLNGDETSVDCGGSCPQCRLGQQCAGPDDCLSSSCVGTFCVEPTCSDRQMNGQETDIDCGGPSCGRCPTDAACGADRDCASDTCLGGQCTAPTCTDRRFNGSETDIDCGGTCPNGCELGQRCAAQTDCSSSVCVDRLCVPPGCNDMLRNLDETAVDCGGPSCAKCDDGLTCIVNSDCRSLRCDGGVCAVASCADRIMNGYESDVDCGGRLCAPCERGDACTDDSDCATSLCRARQCVLGPTAGFTLSSDGGEVPIVIEATSTAVAGDAALTVEYDWGEGDGFEPEASHRYARTGTFTVQQRVTDAFGLTDSAQRMVTNIGLDPITMDAASATINIVLIEQGLALEMRNTLAPGGVRSETSIAPRAGVFYFEATNLTTPGFHGVGLTTATSNFASFGDTPVSYGAQTYGAATSSTGAQTFLQGPLGTNFGYIIDYRGANPTIHMLYESGGTARRIEHPMPTVTAPLYAAFMGSINEHGPMARFNFGADTTNHPFHFDPRAVLMADGLSELAQSVVLGFGGTGARQRTTPPTLMAPADMSAPVGVPITLSASAFDDEDGDRTDSIRWEVEADGYYVRRSGKGGTFTFTPAEIGVYPILVEVDDTELVRTTRRFRITVTGTVPQFDPVRLVYHEGSGEGIQLSADGLQVRYTVDHKNGIRANQGMYGEFQYFEVSRLFFPASNVGCGVIIAQGSINPLSFITTQPSMQVNFLGSIWRDLIHQQEIGADQMAPETFGFAVDYRGLHPIVHVISRNGLQRSVTLTNAWLPVYPMTYGNPVAYTSPPAYDQAINFGATPFVFDPVAVLTAAGVNPTGLQVGWGDANTR